MSLGFALLCAMQRVKGGNCHVADDLGEINEQRQRPVPIGMNR
jgi:hypothetical protein